MNHQLRHRKSQFARNIHKFWEFFSQKWRSKKYGDNCGEDTGECKQRKQSYSSSNYNRTSYVSDLFRIAHELTRGRSRQYSGGRNVLLSIGILTIQYAWNILQLLKEYMQLSDFIALKKSSNKWINCTNEKSTYQRYHYVRLFWIQTAASAMLNT